MKKFFASAAFLVTFGMYALYQNAGTALSYTKQNPSPTISMTRDGSTIVVRQTGPSGVFGSVASAAPPSPPPAKKTTPASAKKSAPTPTPAPVATKPKGLYADGTYTGSVADAYYGYVQVQVNIAGGRIADVTFLQYPNDRSTSRYINSQAMPLLKQEAIQAQSAQVDGVSGASDTSAAFRQSLADALVQAKS